MGESQVRCILTGQQIWDDCVVFLLGPHGYGPQDVPPTRNPGGCNLPFGGSDEVHHWPLTLPVFATVGSCWGTIKSVEQNDYSREHQQVLGCDLKEMFCAVVESRGKVLSPTMKTAADWYADKHIEQAEVWKDSNRYASLYKTAQRQWRASWADIAHVSLDAWKTLCKPEFAESVHRIFRRGTDPFVGRKKPSPYDHWERNAFEVFPVCEYTTLTYQGFIQESESLNRLMSLRVLLDSLRVMGGELRPSVIYGERSDESTALRTRTLQYMLANT